MNVSRSQLNRWALAQKAEKSFWERRSRHHDTIEKKKGKIRRVHARYKPFMEQITRDARLPADMAILDVGSGPTCIGQIFDAGHAAFLDPLMDFYRTAYDGILPEGELLCHPAEKIPKPDNACDVVVCINALDHTASPEAAMEEIARVLRPGGFVILGLHLYPPISALAMYWTKALPMPIRDDAHPMRFTNRSLRKWLLNFPFETAHFLTIPKKNRRFFLGFLGRMEALLALRSVKGQGQ